MYLKTGIVNVSIFISVTGSRLILPVAGFVISAVFEQQCSSFVC